MKSENPEMNQSQETIIAPASHLTEYSLKNSKTEIDGKYQS